MQFDERSNVHRGNGHIDGEPPLSSLAGDFMNEARRLVRAELELAKVELKEQAKETGRGAAFAGAGSILGHTALLCFAAACIALLSLAMPVWASALIVTGVFAIVGYALVSSGKKKLQNVRAPQLSAEFKEDARWLRQTMLDVKAKRHATA